MLTVDTHFRKFGLAHLAVIADQAVVFAVTRNNQAVLIARFAITLAQALVLLFGSWTHASAATNDLLDGITLAGNHTDADAAYLRQNLEMLRDQTTAWYKHIEESKPLTLVVDLNEGAHGRAAIAKCCVAGNRGVITFGHHFGTLADSDDAADQTPEARRIRFLVTLIHEATHVRDQRAGKFLTKTNFKSCVDAEKSAFDKQINFENDLLAVTSGSANAWLAQQVKSENTALKTREMWQLYCGAFEQ